MYDTALGNDALNEHNDFYRIVIVMKRNPLAGGVLMTQTVIRLRIRYKQHEQILTS